MSKAFECDRCGRLFKYDNEYTAIKPVIVYHLGSYCDLCEVCNKELENWFKNVKEEKDETE